MSDTVLKVDNLIVDYGIVRALKGVSIEVKKGKVVAILGANGAGKTTLIKSISGLAKVAGGEIILDGQNVKNLRPYEIHNHGVALSPEGRAILNGLTVEENLQVGAYSMKSKKKIQDLMNQVFEYFPILKDRRRQQASTLSGGEQQMLAIARALMADPKILLLDEPSLGLAPIVVQDIFKIIQVLKEKGTTILIVEQNAYQTLKVADYAYVLELGKIKTEGEASVLLKDESLVEAYLGGNK